MSRRKKKASISVKDKVDITWNNKNSWLIMRCGYEFCFCFGDSHHFVFLVSSTDSGASSLDDHVRTPSHLKSSSDGYHFHMLVSSFEAFKLLKVNQESLLVTFFPVTPLPAFKLNIQDMITRTQRMTMIEKSSSPYPNKQCSQRQL
ncbi:hypothetical protein OIU74_004206 [Salix koriyanagi]|uniref:Uncharacterized protein n=1 Tax=Salix koriyanagi TaxID=2511006 RepID=A0A9Q0UZL2_9ROSI|nr:hypothetical protein OIU74_004206 [Salix koriyanagi]